MTRWYIQCIYCIIIMSNTSTTVNPFSSYDPKFVHIQTIETGPGGKYPFLSLLCWPVTIRLKFWYWATVTELCKKSSAPLSGLYSSALLSTKQAVRPIDHKNVKIWVNFWWFQSITLIVFFWLYQQQLLQNTVRVYWEGVQPHCFYAFCAYFSCAGEDLRRNS